jgi:hypothetical protein
MALRSKSQFVIEETSCLRVIEGNWKIAKTNIKK